MSTCNFRCAFAVKGKHLDFEKIELDLEIKNSTTIKKETYYNTIVNDLSKDILIYTICADSDVDMKNTLKTLIAHLSYKKNVLDRLKEISEIRLICHINTQEIQFFFFFDDEVISEIAELDIDLIISATSINFKNHKLW